jgi:hypothetical protein
MDAIMFMIEPHQGLPFGGRAVFPGMHFDDFVCGVCGCELENVLDTFPRIHVIAIRLQNYRA